MRWETRSTEPSGSGGDPEAGHCLSGLGALLLQGLSGDGTLDNRPGGWRRALSRARSGATRGWGPKPPVAPPRVANGLLRP
jgi:hypothetical protein